MRIALFNAFPFLPCSAEKEFIQRCRIVLAKGGHDAHEVCTSTEVIRLNPDFVLVTHHVVPKLTAHFTVGVLWSPTQYYREDAKLLHNIASWDLIVPIGERTRAFAQVLQFSLQRPSAVTNRVLFPSSPIVDVTMPNVRDLSLAYIGVRWDGDRHGSLLRMLSEAVDLNIYGPLEAWIHFPRAYRGSIPVNGRAVVQTLNRHGAVLALHKNTHCAEDTPSMRVFEGCAAKCLVISDAMSSVRGRFGDSLEYLDLAEDPVNSVQQIANIVQAARLSTEATLNRIASAHRIFCEHVSLDALLPPLVEEIVERAANVAARWRVRSVRRASLPMIDCGPGNEEMRGEEGP